MTLLVFSGIQDPGDRDGAGYRYVLSLPANQSHEERTAAARRGDKEAELGLPFSPLCDRFIDFIVEPTFTVLTDMTEKIVTPLIEEASHSGLTGFRRSSLNSISPSEVKRSSVKSTGSEGSASLNCSILTVDFKCFKNTWTEVVQQNREKWKAQATKEEKVKKEAEENSQQATEDKKIDEKEGKKPMEETTASKSEKSKEGNSGETKSTEASKSKLNGTRQTGGSKHDASPGKNITQVEKETEFSPAAGDQKQHVQNGALQMFWSSTPISHPTWPVNRNAGCCRSKQLTWPKLGKSALQFKASYERCTSARLCKSAYFARCYLSYHIYWCTRQP
ncbi:Calcium/calmodulin-dependent 3',5'-cyclic nucleotide phosphodiesterase 1C [Varanus komodoensis]|nr:Calcium/calmodulin-dependent 3',5'-cyclic nucleotide phosphodiesterase 1C [Varanus komodoensis]